VLAALHVVDIDLPKTIAAMALLATAIGVPSLIGAHRARHDRRRSAQTTETLIRAVKSTNGSEQTLAEEISARFDGMDARLGSLDIVAQANAMTLRVVVDRQEVQGADIREIRAAVNEIDGSVDTVGQHLTDHIDGVKELTDWVSEQSGITPGEGKEDKP
jgi:hypothetical protein